MGAEYYWVKGHRIAGHRNICCGIKHQLHTFCTWTYHNAKISPDAWLCWDIYDNINACKSYIIATWRSKSSLLLSIYSCFPWNTVGWYASYIESYRICLFLDDFLIMFIRVFGCSSVTMHKRKGDVKIVMNCSWVTLKKVSPVRIIVSQLYKNLNLKKIFPAM